MKHVDRWQTDLILRVNLVQLQELPFWKKLLSPCSSYIKGTPHIEHSDLLPQRSFQAEGKLQFENLKRKKN
jgi:hypothetical protein